MSLGERRRCCLQGKSVSWDKYMKLAQGEKVLDNPQLLRKALKKEGKDKAKRAAAWQTRTQAVADKQQAQQQQYDISHSCGARPRGALAACSTRALCFLPVVRLGFK